MKQIARLTTILMLLLVGAGFAACSDDDDEKSGSASIVGSWRYNWYNEDGSKGYQIMTFRSDGTGSDHDVDLNEDGNIASNYEYKFIYTYKNGLLTITYENGETDSGYVTISGNKLTMDGDTFYRVS